MTVALLVTGTDTGVGKTYVSCRVIETLRAAGHAVGAFKPAVSGSVDGRWDDADALAEATGWAADDVCPQRFHAPLAPPDAAAAEGRSVDEAAIDTAYRAAAGRCELLVVEGAGGLLSPLTDRQSVGDWAAGRRLPLLAVVEVKLGAINQALLLAESAERRRLPTAFVLNEPRPCDPAVRRSTVGTLARELGDRIVAQVAPGGPLRAFDPGCSEITQIPEIAVRTLLRCFASLPS